jgi:DNA-binding FrmR family transcriptional regulator
MVEADADCSDVLMQVVSARQPLKSFSEEMIESHLHECIENAATQSEGRRPPPLAAHRFKAIRGLKQTIGKRGGRPP